MSSVHELCGSLFAEQPRQFAVGKEHLALELLSHVLVRYCTSQTADLRLKNVEVAAVLEALILV